MITEKPQRPTVGARVLLDRGEGTVITVRFGPPHNGRRTYKLRVQPDDLSRPPRWIGPVV